jgi:LCP family protein required for cell wall assembly
MPSAAMPAPPRPARQAPPAHPQTNGNGRPPQQSAQPPNGVQQSAQMPVPPAESRQQQSAHLPIPPAEPRQQQSAHLPIPNGVQSSAHLPIPNGAQSAQLPVTPEMDKNPGVPPALKRPAPPNGRVPLPPRRDDADLVSMTTEMEAISEGVQQIRRVDATLARFSAVHDELAEEERLKKEKRERLMPWLKGEGEDDEEPDVLAVTQAGTFDQELAELPTVLARPAGAEDDERDLPTVLTKPAEKSRPPKRLARTGRITAAALAGILLIGTGVMWGAKQWLDDQFKEVASLDPNSSDIKNGAQQLGDENFLMVGSDTREGAKAEDGVGSAADIEGARTDTIMIAHIPKDRKRVVMVSFPRDLEINRPACDRYDSKNSTYPGGQAPAAKNAKLNTAFFVGGPKCVTKVIQNITGLKINHFVGIDFNGFKGMVDAVQGVEVCVAKPMYDSELKTWIVETPGQNVKLTGDAALNFVRARHVKESPTAAKEDPTADYGRIKRQQRFLSALLRKAMSGQVLLDVNKLTDFVGAFTKATFGEGIATNDLITLGGSLQNVGAGRVTFITVPTVGEANSRGNEVLREKDTQNLFNAIINDTPLPGEQPDPGPQAQAGNQPPESLLQPKIVDPKTVKVQVLNGGAKDGKARTVATDLGKQGFQILRTGTSGDNVPKTEVRYGHAANEAHTLASSLPGSVLKQDPSLGGAVILVLGPDFDNGKVVAPGSGGTPSNGGGTPPPTSTVPKGLSTINAGDDACA